MGMPMGWAYACIPVGSALMLFHLLVIMIRDTPSSILLLSPGRRQGGGGGSKPGISEPQLFLWAFSSA